MYYKSLIGITIRVSKGGHTIPNDVIERRYYKGLRNFSRFAKAANDWYVYDNSGSGYELVAKNVEGEEKIINFNLFKEIVGKWITLKKEKTLAKK